MIGFRKILKHFLYMTTEANILYANYWKLSDIFPIEEWWVKILDIAEKDMIFLKEKSVL